MTTENDLPPLIGGAKKKTRLFVSMANSTSQ